LGTADAGPIRQNLDMASFAAETGLKLLGKSVQQTGESTEGLQRDWLVVASSADKHYGYAFQWFGLSGLTFILYVWFQIVRFRAKKQ
jgi:surfeit locus 1 family protein